MRFEIETVLSQHPNGVIYIKGFNLYVKEKWYKRTRAVGSFKDTKSLMSFINNLYKQACREEAKKYRV